MADKGSRGRPTFREIQEQLKARKAEPPTKPFNVSLTDSAKAVYLQMEERHRKAEEAGDSTNQHCTTFRMVDEAIRRLIPADPLNPKYALHAPLTDMYRIAKGRIRIAWAVEADHREILIIYISDSLRKDGDQSDPYVILNAMAKAGFLTTIIEDWRRAFQVPPDAPVN